MEQNAYFETTHSKDFRLKHRVMKDRMECAYTKDTINNAKKLRNEMIIMTACTRELEYECESMREEIKSLEKETLFCHFKLRRKII